MNFKVKIYFANPLVAIKKDNLVLSSVDGLNWHFIKIFVIGLESFLLDKEIITSKDPSTFLEVSQSENTLIAGYIYAVEAESAQILLNNITDFLSSVVNKNLTSKDLFNDAPINNSIENFLMIRSGGKIKYPLILDLNGTKFKISGKFSEVDFLIDDIEKEFVVSAKIRLFDKDKRSCSCTISEGGGKISFHYDHILFFQELYSHFAEDKYSNFKVRESRNAKGKKILNLIMIQ